MRKVLVNVEFKDKYTRKKYEAGKKYDMTNERIAEVKEVNPDFITVISEESDNTCIESELAKAKEELAAAKEELKKMKAKK